MLELPNASKAKVERLFDKRDPFRRALAKEIFMSKGNAAQFVEVLQLAICDAIEDPDERLRYLGQLIKALTLCRRREDLRLPGLADLVEAAEIISRGEVT